MNDQMCKSCTKRISWVEEIPCKPELEKEIAEWINKQKEKKLKSTTGTATEQFFIFGFIALISHIFANYAAVDLSYLAGIATFVLSFFGFTILSCIFFPWVFNE